MSTVKITELSELQQLNSNTDLTVVVGVDIESDITGKITATTLANGLYAHNVLNVGNNAVVFADVIGQFVSEGTNYLQVNLQNTNGDASTDWVASADNATDATNFIDLGINGSTFNDSNYSSMKANDGYLVVMGEEGLSHGNLIVGTGTTGTQIKFIAGGLELDNIVGTITSTGAHFPNIDTAISANLSVAEAYTDTANAFLQAIDNAQNTRISAAFTKANNALANTSGTFDGNLNVTGSVTSSNISLTGDASISFNPSASPSTVLFTTRNLTVTGNTAINQTLIVANATYDYTNTALMKIVGSTGAMFQPPANPGYMLSITGVDGVASRVVNSSYGTGAYALFAGRKGNGTAGSPTAVANNDVIARFSGSGYNGSAFTATGQARIDIVADENFSTANNGSRIEFYNTIPNTNTVTKIATFNANTVTFLGAVKPTKGFILTPNVTGTTLTKTIDFSQDNLLKFDVNDNATITLSNYVTGKVVDVWITNSAAQNKTITHGCFANNSTTKATSFTITSNSCARLKYFSIGTDQANTFVSVTA